MDTSQFKKGENMGYYTSYNLTIENDGAKISDVIEWAKAHNNDLAYFDCFDDELCMTSKWYDYMEDMYDLSIEFPYAVFKLFGDGDDCDDLWEEYWQNGKVQHCHAEIPPYDPLKMKPYNRRVQ